LLVNWFLLRCFHWYWDWNVVNEALYKIHKLNKSHMMQKIQQAGGRSKVPSPSPLDTAPHLIYKKISLSEKVKAKS